MYKNDKTFYIITGLLLYMIYQNYIKESMISYPINNKQFKVYDKFHDYKSAGEMLYKLDKDIQLLFNHLNKKYLQSGKYKINKLLKSRIEHLIKTYDCKNLSEHFPKKRTFGGKAPDSSYTLNKKKIFLCLRDDKTKKFHEYNEIMFVLLHELSHICFKGFQHPEFFWVYFKFILHESVEIGIYNPIDYRKKNSKYCNTQLKANPYFNRIKCRPEFPNSCK